MESRKEHALYRRGFVIVHRNLPGISATDKIGATVPKPSPGQKTPERGGDGLRDKSR